MNRAVGKEMRIDTDNSDIPQDPVPGEPPRPLAEQVTRETPDRPASDSFVLLEGAFTDMPLREVLDVVALARQQVELVFSDADGTLGSLVVEAGQLLAAHSALSGARGREAFLELLHHPGRSFALLRCTGGAGHGEPVGDFAEIVGAANAPPQWRPEPLEDDDDENLPTVVLGPRLTPGPPVTETAPLDARVHELSAAITSLQDLLSARPAEGRPSPDRPLLVGLATVQLLTLAVAVAVFVQVLLER